MVESQNTEKARLNCEQVWREVSNYVDGDVDATLRSAMDEHFKTCKRCASVLAGTRNVVQLYGDERMLEVPAGFSRRLEKRLTQHAVVKGRAMVELVGVAGAGGGDCFDRGQCVIDQLADSRTFPQIAPCGTRQ